MLLSAETAERQFRRIGGSGARLKFTVGTQEKIPKSFQPHQSSCESNWDGGESVLPVSIAYVPIHTVGHFLQCVSYAHICATCAVSFSDCLFLFMFRGFLLFIVVVGDEMVYTKHPHTHTALDVRHLRKPKSLENMIHIYIFDIFGIKWMKLTLNALD